MSGYLKDDANHLTYSEMKKKIPPPTTTTKNEQRNKPNKTTNTS